MDKETLEQALEKVAKWRDALQAWGSVSIAVLITHLLHFRQELAAACTESS